MFYLKNNAGGLCLLLLLWQGNVCAQDVKMYDEKAPTAKEMGDVLFSSQPAEMKPGNVKMRSIRFGKPKNALPEPISASQQTATIGLPIKFGRNSTAILEESKPILNEIGKMLGLSNFANEKLLIEGHTDASGSEFYNQILSERRANSVKKYLTDHFNIATNRLYITGKGESQPLPGFAPDAAVNRRVQFRKAP